MEKLIRLANGCQNGACNIIGIVRSLFQASEEVGPHEFNNCAAVKIIVAHLNFLTGQGIGPSEEAVAAFDKEAALYQSKQQ